MSRTRVIGQREEAELLDFGYHTSYLVKGRAIPPNYNYKSYRKNYRYNIVFRRIVETTVSLYWMLQPHAEPKLVYKEIKPRR